MVDRYTKMVLTIIAAALVVIVVRQTAPPAKAAFSDCGGTAIDPCYMKIWN